MVIMVIQLPEAALQQMFWKVHLDDFKKSDNSVAYLQISLACLMSSQKF
jgi:hypothetical protein